MNLTDAKEYIEKVVESVTKDKSLSDRFSKDPLGTIKDILGSAIPEDMLEKISAGVKAKISSDKIADAAKSLGNLFK